MKGGKILALGDPKEILESFEKEPAPEGE